MSVRYNIGDFVRLQADLNDLFARHNESCRQVLQVLTDQNNGGAGVPYSALGNNNSTKVGKALEYLYNLETGPCSERGGQPRYLPRVWHAVQAIQDERVRQQVVARLRAPSVAAWFPLPPLSTSGAVIMSQLVPDRVDVASIVHQLVHGNCVTNSRHRELLQKRRFANAFDLGDACARMCVPLDEVCAALVQAGRADVACELSGGLFVGNDDEHVFQQPQQQVHSQQVQQQQQEQRPIIGNAVFSCVVSTMTPAQKQAAWRNYFASLGASQLGRTPEYAVMFVQRYGEQLSGWRVTKQVLGALDGIGGDASVLTVATMDAFPFLAPFVRALAVCCNLQSEWRDVDARECMQHAHHALLSNLAVHTLAGKPTAEALAADLKQVRNTSLLRELVHALPDGVVRHKSALYGNVHLVLSQYDQSAETRCAFLAIFARHYPNTCFFVDATTMLNAYEEELAERTPHHAAVATPAPMHNWVDTFSATLSLDDDDRSKLATFLVREKVQPAQLSHITVEMWREAGLSFGALLEVQAKAAPFVRSL